MMMSRWRAIADSRERSPRLPVRPGSVAEPVQQDRCDAKVLARFREIPPLEFALRTRDNLLDLREEAEPVSLEKQGADPRLVQGPPVRFPRNCGSSERSHDPFHMIDASGVLTLADRAPRGPSASGLRAAPSGCLRSATGPIAPPSPRAIPRRRRTGP